MINISLLAFFCQKKIKPTYSSFKLYKFIVLPPPFPHPRQLLFQGVYLWLIPITSNIDNNENTWHLFSVEMWKLQSNIYRTHFSNHCSQIWLSNSKTWHSKSVTSCSRAVSGPILYIFKFMSMPLEKHHLPSWSIMAVFWLPTKSEIDILDLWEFVMENKALGGKKSLQNSYE